MPAWRSRTEGGRRRPPVSCLLPGLLLVVTGCASGAPPDARPPVATLAIVTATPGVPVPAHSPTAERRYIVREGDSLSSIARRHDVTETAILRANSLTNPDHIVVGQELIVPPPEP